MQVFTLLLKLAADLRSQNGQAKATLFKLIALLFGYVPVDPEPDPVPSIAPAPKGAVASDECNEAAEKIELFCTEHQPLGMEKIGDGVLLGKLIELVKVLLPLILKL